MALSAALKMMRLQIASFAALQRHVCNGAYDELIAGVVFRQRLMPRVIRLAHANEGLNLHRHFRCASLALHDALSVSLRGRQ